MAAVSPLLLSKVLRGLLPGFLQNRKGERTKMKKSKRYGILSFVVILSGVSFLIAAGFPLEILGKPFWVKALFSLARMTSLILGLCGILLGLLLFVASRLSRKEEEEAEWDAAKISLGERLSEIVESAKGKSKESDSKN